jgi:hypothetical protein
MLPKHTLHRKARAADILFLREDNCFIRRMRITLHRTLTGGTSLARFPYEVAAAFYGFGRRGGYLASELHSRLNTEAHKHLGGMGCKHS